MNCVICHSQQLNYFDQYSLLKRVTSDCKPWPAGGELTICTACGAVQKIVNERWLTEINQIYSEYEAYYQAGGEEQAVFNKETGAPMKRSQQLVKFIKESGLFNSETGKVLDYGCATGGFLSAFSIVYEQAELFGFDLSKKYEARLETIKNFRQLFTGSIDATEKFHVISLIHSLEHLVTPVQTLEQLKEHLHTEGFLFIQVPNIVENPFDILVADHLLHFTPDSLSNLLDKAGFEVKLLSTDAASKELSVIAAPAKNQLTLGSSNRVSHYVTNKALVDHHLQLMSRLLSDVAALSAQGDFAIFGTSISATWVYGYHPEVSCFIDEDPNRIGKEYFGKPIYSPVQIPQGMTTYIPLSKQMVKNIKARFAQQNFKLNSPYDERAAV